MTTVKQLEEQLNNFYKTTEETLKQLSEEYDTLIALINQHEQKIKDFQNRFELIYQYNQNHEKLRHQSPRHIEPDYYDQQEYNRRNYNEHRY